MRPSITRANRLGMRLSFDFSKRNLLNVYTQTVLDHDNSNAAMFVYTVVQFCQRLHDSYSVPELCQLTETITEAEKTNKSSALAKTSDRATAKWAEKWGYFCAPFRGGS